MSEDQTREVVGGSKVTPSTGMLAKRALIREAVLGTQRDYTEGSIGRAIGRTIVNYDDFALGSGRTKGGDDRSDCGFFVERGNDDGDRGWISQAAQVA